MRASSSRKILARRAKMSQTRRKRSRQPVSKNCQLHSETQIVKRALRSRQQDFGDLCWASSHVLSFEDQRSPPHAHHIIYEYHTLDTLPLAWQSVLWRIFSINMRDHYVANCSWREHEKRSELFAPESRYLLAMQNRLTETKSGSDTCTSLALSAHRQKADAMDIIGFVHLRYVLDHEEEPVRAVLYVYEIQLDPRVQRYGIGSKLMAIVEQLADRLHIRKLMLTVFRSNTSALGFYRDRLGYATDPSSPSAWGLDACYEIMSKMRR